MDKEWGQRLEREPSFIVESISEEGRKPRQPYFNADFMLDFVDRDANWSKSKITMSPILPNTLGAELFLAVEEGTLRPMRLELMGGGAFPVRHYAKYIDSIETAIKKAMNIPQVSNRLCGKAVSQEFSVGASAFARIMVIQKDICFLVCPKYLLPTMRGEHSSLVREKDCEIDCYIDGEEVVCFDGWLSTDVTWSEWKLVAI